MPIDLPVQVTAFALSFILALIAGPVFIPILARLKFGQTVRDDGPSTHLKKTGTPTMGGFIILIPAIISAALFTGNQPHIAAMLIAVSGYGMTGFADDFIKVVKKRKDGLYAWQKTILQALVSIGFIIYIMFYTDLGTYVIIPYPNGGIELYLPPWLYAPFIFIILYGFTNAVNLTDGVDGLCAGVTVVVLVFFTAAAMVLGDPGGVKPFAAAFAGGCLGFLSFNLHPAKVFMGDTGSLAIGGAVACSAIIMRMPVVLLLVGILYVLEAFSVIIQVASFKLTGKRVFKMSPLHHHFELSGWKETKVVYVFLLFTIAACIVAALLLF